MAAKQQQFTPVENPTEFLRESSDKLVKFGGFELLESCIEGVQNLNPERKARKRIFLTENEQERRSGNLKKNIRNMV